MPEPRHLGCYGGCLRTPIDYDAIATMTFTCPSCQNPAVDGQTNCIACGFSLAEADRQLGIPPQLSAPVADRHQHLSASDVRRIAALTAAIEKKFPQVHLAVAIEHMPEGMPLPVFTFWLFNRAGISSSVERGPDNHLVLLVINADAAGVPGASCMIGYGLEPFIRREQLDGCLAAISPHLNARRHGKAALGFFTALQAVLQESCIRANQREQLKDTPTDAPSELVPTDAASD